MPVSPLVRPGCTAILVGIEDAETLTRVCHFASLISLPATQLNRVLLAGLNPRCVVLPLFPRGADISDLLDRLEECRFAGRILILAPPLPRRGMVLAELQAHAPGLRLQLLVQPAP
jgi:hypothetical protein